MINIVENPYSSIVVTDEDGELIIIREQDNIQFTIESTGETKKGKIIKFNGKKEKLKIQILPEEKECHEIWPVILIAEGTLKLVG